MSKGRSRVNPRIDKKVFKRTASRTKARNLPGKMISRGGQML